LNGVTEASHGSLLTAQDSQKILLDMFKAKMGTPTFLTPRRSRINASWVHPAAVLRIGMQLRVVSHKI